jgi:hypothetical protein
MSNTHHSLLPGETKVSAFPRFFVESELQEFKSNEAGHSIYADVEMVEVIIPGDSKSTWAGRVKQEHKDRWPREYEAFKKGQAVEHDGYPLKMWPPMTPALVATLGALNVYTVEQLAAVQDGALQNLGTGGRQLRDKAKMFLEQQAGGEPLARIVAELEQMKAQVALLERDNADLKARATEKAAAQ